MWFGDPIWKHARWTPMFQTANDRTTVTCGATGDAGKIVALAPGASAERKNGSTERPQEGK